MALQLLANKVMTTASKFYQRAVAHELVKTGECGKIDTVGSKDGFVCCSLVLVMLVEGVDLYCYCCLQVLTTPYNISGLRYEDLLNEEDNDIKEALSLASAEVKTGRTRRVKRALDLNLKQKNFMDYAKDVEQETWKTEIYDDMLKIRARNQEFALLNQHKK
jgi:hypothetical protein